MAKREDNIIEEIIDNELVTVYFQPLVFIKKKKVAGYRAECTGKGPDGSVLMPGDMIREAEKYGFILQVDRLLRKKSLEDFLHLYKNNRELLLSLSINSSAVKNGFGPDRVRKTVESFGIDPSNVILELAEPEFDDTEQLLDYITQYRRSGFMIELDGFGTGLSSRERILVLRPDLIRLAGSIIKGISNDLIKQEIAHSFISLARKTGALVIAGGVNSAEDALKAMDLDADILQGDFFSTLHIPLVDDAVDLTGRINMLSAEFLEMKDAQYARDDRRVKHCIAMLERIVKDIIESGMYLPDDAVKNAIEKYSGIECIYILDERGIQVTDIFINRSISNTSPGKIFSPDMIYTDHSNKDYYMKLRYGDKHYISSPYISSITGNMCITASGKYNTAEGEGRILCADLSARERF